MKGKNGWTTIDLTNIHWDLRNGIPFPNSSVDVIYSSHVFEHIPFQGIIKLLKECNRVLKTGGKFSICVPNSRLYVEAYITKSDNFWASKPHLCFADKA